MSHRDIGRHRPAGIAGSRERVIEMPTTSPVTGSIQHERHGSDTSEVAIHGRHPARRSWFWRHFAEMLGVMAIGMVASGYALVRAVGLTSWDTATIRYPTQCLLVMAAGMTVPMVAWMLYRGMGVRNTVEMAALMILRRPLPGPRVVRRHGERVVRCVLWLHRRRDARTDPIPQGGVCPSPLAGGGPQRVWSRTRRVRRRSCMGSRARGWSLYGPSAG